MTWSFYSVKLFALSVYVKYLTCSSLRRRKYNPIIFSETSAPFQILISDTNPYRLFHPFAGK